MNDKIPLLIAISALVFSLILFGDEVDASSIKSFSELLQMLVLGQTDLMKQNNVLIDQQYQMIDQNEIMIKLLKADPTIFVPGLTDRFDLIEYKSYGKCKVYDRLQRIFQDNTCPIVGLTKDQFNSLITGNPEN